MGKFFNVGAKLRKNNKFNCTWKDCPGEGHERRITYPRESYGKTETKTGIPKSTCLHPEQEIPQKGVLLYPNRKGKIKMRKNVSYYPVQRHHVIPGEIFEANTFPYLQENLRLLGWNMNDGKCNGISLPKHIASIAWHGLQIHNGSHPIYTRRVEASLGEIETDLEEKHYCIPRKEGKESISPDLLDEKIQEEVNTWRERLIKWETLIHPTTPARAQAELNNPNRCIRLSPEPLFPGDTTKVYKRIPLRYL